MILITGASSGIGASTARAFAREKRPLILWGRRRDRLEAERATCLELGAPSVNLAAFDVRDARALDSEIGSNRAIYEKTEVVVNNAGLARGMSPFQDSKLSDLDEMVDVNVKAFVHVAHAILPFLLAKNSGHMIHLGSAAARWPYPKGHVYCATKAAVHALSQTIRMDLNGTRIRVTEISPGMVETEFSETRFGDKQRAKAVYQGMVPLRPEDIADAIVWAASRPAHVNVAEMVLYPVDQASTTQVARRT
jgi:NADP-dependent 3-hydroxy acid dehydrogenase YdfG